MSEARPSFVPDGDLYSESDVKVEASGSRTPEEITDEARAIHNRVRRMLAAGLNLEDQERVRNLEADLRNKHPEFASSFPIPFRWMIQAGEFDAGVFTRWLKRTQTEAMWDTRAAWLESQGQYLTALYRHRNRRATPREVAAFEKQTQEALRTETADHRKIVEEVTVEVEEEKEAVAQARRARLTAFCGSHSAEQLATRLRQTAALDRGSTLGLETATIDALLAESASTGGAKGPSEGTGPGASPPETVPAAAEKGSPEL
jgi:hypothetical protein